MNASKRAELLCGALGEGANHLLPPALQFQYNEKKRAKKIQEEEKRWETWEQQQIAAEERFSEHNSRGLEMCRATRNQKYREQAERARSARKQQRGVQLRMNHQMKNREHTLLQKQQRNELYHLHKKFRKSALGKPFLPR
jgi:hypothetical protein